MRLGWLVLLLSWHAATCVNLRGTDLRDSLDLDINVDYTAPRPNILVFLIDDMGYSDLGCFGSQNHSTPNVDKLVASGIKFTQWVSGAPICTPSRAALQTGRYPIRSGCMGNVERYRVIPTPSNPGGLDPAKQMSIATALKKAGYRTGMSGKWHLGINSNEIGHKQDHLFTPTANGYDSYLGSPYTNAPMCAMDGDGVSDLHDVSPTFCFMTANNTVVQMPLRLENFTRDITDHALDFLNWRAEENTGAPWYFFMSYFHVHTPLFTNRHNRGRSQGGEFGDNVEEMDDSVGEIMAAVQRLGFGNNTLVFLTSDNGPYQEEGWANSGRTNLYSGDKRVSRLKGGKGQVFEGGVRMPGGAVWPGVTSPGRVSDTLVSTMDIFPTAMAVAGVSLPASYPVDGKDMTPVLRGDDTSQHSIFLHYCGFKILAARVSGRFKVFWGYQKWYTNDPRNSSICLECCNGVNPSSKFTGTVATELCGCADSDITMLTTPEVYDMSVDLTESHPLTAANWPKTTGTTYEAVVAAATDAKQTMEQHVHPQPDKKGAGTCTEGLPSPARQPCCPGCEQLIPMYGHCDKGLHKCSCNLAADGQRGFA